jgi:hypothetical protein
MRLGCVVRVESIRQDPTMSLWGKSCRRGVTWASLVRGTYGGCMDEQTGCWLCNTPGVYHQLSSGFKLKHDRLVEMKMPKSNLWK